MTALHTDEHRRLVAVLAEARKSAGMTQEELSEQLRRDQTWVSKYEAGRQRLDVIEFLRIGAVLGLDPAIVIKQIGEISLY